MTKQQILNHFKPGDVVACLLTKGYTGVFNENHLVIYNDMWMLKIPDRQLMVVIESNGKLARIIQHDKTEVYAQLGKEVEVILESDLLPANKFNKIRKLYGK